MNANELMIGDWVYAKVQVDDTGTEPVFERTPKRVTDLTNSINGIYVEGTSQFAGAEIEPIPLTQEVLEKNGFVCVEVGDNGIGTPAKFRNRFEKWECRTQWHTFHVFYDRIRHSFSLNAAYSNHIEGMQYVHELQHALRISGIDKEVEL